MWNRGWNTSTDRKKKRSTKKTKMSSTDRKKMIVLYFVCKVVIAKSKSDGNIDEFILIVVDDLHACEEFLWGYFTFDESMKKIWHVMKKLNGFVKPNQQIAFSGFIFPLEIMVFKCILHLGHKFREVILAEKECPRMCKHKFSESVLRGHPLEDITKELRSTKDITTILEPDFDEKHLLSRIIDNKIDDGICFIDPLVDTWRERLLLQRKNIYWKDLCELDLGSCPDPEKVAQVPEDIAQVHVDVVAHILELKEAMDKRFDKIIAKIGDKEKY